MPRKEYLVVQEQTVKKTSEKKEDCFIVCDCLALRLLTRSQPSLRDYPSGSVCSF